MHHALTFATALADALTAHAGLAATVYPLASTEAAALPKLAVLVPDLSPPHPKALRGTLTLRYEFDADSTTAEAAAADLQDAAEYLTSEDGAAAIQALLKPDGIWLRRLGTGGFASTTAETGERTRSMDLTTVVFLQTDL